MAVSQPFVEKRPQQRTPTPVPTSALRWVSTVLYVAVLVASIAFDLRSDGGPHAAELAGFAGLIAVLIGLDAYERSSYVGGAPAGVAAALLAARLVLLLVLISVDPAGMSRPLFVLIPFTAYFAFGRTTSLALAGLLVAIFVTRLALTEPDWQRDLEHVSDVLMFVLGLVLAVSMASVAVAEQRASERLTQAMQELRIANTRLEASAEQVAELSTVAERNRLARDIHDGLGHHLTAVAVQLEKAAAFRARDAAVADQAVRDAQTSARRALEDVRTSVYALRQGPPAFHLADALADLVAGSGTDPQATLSVTGEQDGYDAASMTALFRAAQEALTNCRRHAGARHVSIELAFTSELARLDVADDGCGFAEPVGSPAAGFGLLGMSERVRLVGGRVDVTGTPGEGTRVVVTILRHGSAGSRHE